MTVIVTDELKDILGSELSIGKIDIGLLNRIIIDDVLLHDRQGEEMLKVTRLSAKFEFLPLLQGKISIGSVQLFGFNINLHKDTPGSTPNFQFILDAFASQDTLKKNKLDLRLNSILIRRGKLSYDVLSEPETPGKFNSKHVKLNNIIANISLKALSNDSINGYIKRLSLNEQSGLEINKLSLRVLANQEHLRMDNFSLELPNSSLNMDTVRLDYDGFGAFSNIVHDVYFNGKMLPSHITLSDISSLIPVFDNFHEKLHLGMEFNGTIDQLSCPKLEINAGKDIDIRGNVSFQDLSAGNDAYVYGAMSRLEVSRDGMDFLVRNLVKSYSKTPDLLKQLGNISFKGEISGYFNQLVTYGLFKTDLGMVKADVKFTNEMDIAKITSEGEVETKDFNLGKLISREDLLGKISFGLHIEATKYKETHPRVKLKGMIASLFYSNYNYQNIDLDGEYRQGGFDGRITLNDENGIVQLNGSFDTASKIPVFNFHAELKDVRPHNLNLTSDYQDALFSLQLNANFEGSSIDNVIGEINMDNFTFDSPDKHYFLDNINMKATREGDNNRLTFTSEFLKAEVKGNYSYQTIPASIIKTIERYIPSLLTMNKAMKEPHNNFSFDIHIYDTSLLSEVFDIPLYIYTHSTIKGYFNDIGKKLRVEGYFPSFRYGKNLFESGMILCENPSEDFLCHLRVSNRGKNNSVINLSLNAEAQNDELRTAINWGNNSKVTHSGKFSAITNFFKTEGNNPLLQANIEIEPTEIILNDSIWTIHSSQIAVDSGRVYVDNFLINHGDQFLNIDGKLTKEETDTVKVTLKDINVGYIFDIVRLKSVDFNGMASGTLFVNQAFKKPEMNTRLFIRNLVLNNGLLGDAHIFGEWDKEKNGIYLNADINEENIFQTKVDGYIFIKDKGLDLSIKGNGTNISFIEYYMDEIVSGLKGRVYGNARLFGGFSSLNLEADVLADASLKVNVLNTSYLITDSLRFRKEEFTFKDITIHDTEGHTGTLNGYLRHNHFKNLRYNFRIYSDNLLVYNTKEDRDMPFYGTVYGTGSVLLNGNPSGLNVDVDMSTDRNTNFVYLLASTASATSNQFITFVDKTPKRNAQDSVFYTDLYDQLQVEEKKPMDIRLNLQVDATPDATMKIIMDPISGDYISGKGSGNIRVDFYNKGDVRMFGGYTIDQGIYKFSLQEVIRKDFNIKAGSNIEFNGNPLNANMDIQAVYMVNSASLNDLGVGEFKQNNVRVNCIMNLNGNLTRPDIKFDLELPNVSEDERELVRTAISTEEQMNMQILYLLGIGKFYTYDYGNNINQSGNAMNSVLSSTLSGQFNNMLSHIINNNNWNFGTSISTGDKGWTDMEFEAMLSGQLLNNRLLINGNFGYRENQLTTNNNNTNFVGDFDIEYLLTRSGELRLKAYNQTNDNRYLTKTTLTTQGVGIVYKKDFNSWRDLLIWNKKKDTRPSKTSSDSIRVDSITISEKFSEKERSE